MEGQSVNMMDWFFKVKNLKSIYSCDNDGDYNHSNNNCDKKQNKTAQTSKEKKANKKQSKTFIDHVVLINLEPG